MANAASGKNALNIGTAFLKPEQFHNTYNTFTASLVITVAAYNALTFSYAGLLRTKTDI